MFKLIIKYYQLNTLSIIFSILLQSNSYMIPPNTHKIFANLLRDPYGKFDYYIACLLLPQNQEYLKKLGKTIFSVCRTILVEQCEKYLIQRVAKFCMMAIMVGHLHILQLFNRYFLRQVLDLASGVSKFSPLNQHDILEISPIKLRSQFVCELVYLLSRWFPEDLVNSEEQSIYMKIVDKKKINLKGYFILTSSFIKSVESQLQQIKLQENEICYYCSMTLSNKKQKIINKNKGILKSQLTDKTPCTKPSAITIEKKSNEQQKDDFNIRNTIKQNKSLPKKEKEIEINTGKKQLRAQRKVKLNIKNDVRQQTSLVMNKQQTIHNYLQNSIVDQWADIKKCDSYVKI